MALTYSVLDDKSVKIQISGRFDFNLHKDFRKAYEEFPPASKFVVDLAQAEYIDSSALGMLLLLRDHAGGDKASIEITHCSQDIYKVLKIANFHQLFNIA